ncbi:helix-turn-helix domain-containing protein [Thiocapsa sp.]|uniref:helix-turn-helix domain-containing protein n=1 Tax=Thiocapsa sp. TaxID=2024551 RepID=UPI003592E957
MTNVTPLSTLHTEKQEAARLSVSVRTLQAWRTRGEGPPYIKAGRAVRYDPRRTDEWLATKARRHTADPGPQAA